MKKKISLLLVGILVFTMFLTACGNGGTKDQVKNTGKEDTPEVEAPKDNGETETTELEEIIANGKIVFGTSAGYPPFEFHAMVDGKDKIVGFDIEIAKYIADELGVELEIKDMDFDKLLGGLSTGMMDMVIAGMNPDPERDANFSDIYYEANLSVLITKDAADTITKAEDLNGKSIGVQMGTTQETIAQEDFENTQVKSLGKNPDIVMNLKTKKIDCAIMETPVAESFAKVNDDLMVVENLIIDSGSGGVAIATKKGSDELTEKLNEILAKIENEGLLEAWIVEANELSGESL